MEAIYFYIQNLPLALLTRGWFYIASFILCILILVLGRFKGRTTKTIFLLSFIIEFFLFRHYTLINSKSFNFNLHSVFGTILVWSIYYFPFHFIWKKIVTWSTKNLALSKLLALGLILVVAYMYFQNFLVNYGICRLGTKVRVRQDFATTLECYTPSIYEGKKCNLNTDCGNGQCMFSDGGKENGKCIDVPRRSSKSVIF